MKQKKRERDSTVEEFLVTLSLQGQERSVLFSKWDQRKPVLIFFIGKWLTLSTSTDSCLPSNTPTVLQNSVVFKTCCVRHPHSKLQTRLSQHGRNWCVWTRAHLFTLQLQQQIRIHFHQTAVHAFVKTKTWPLAPAFWGQTWLSRFVLHVSLNFIHTLKSPSFSPPTWETSCQPSELRWPR